MEFHYYCWLEYLAHSELKYKHIIVGACEQPYINYLKKRGLVDFDLVPCRGQYLSYVKNINLTEKGRAVIAVRQLEKM
jgi:hypothetical protein